MRSSKLSAGTIRFVEDLSIDVKTKVLYEYLKKGTSNRDIEKCINELNEADGWEAWSVIHFYGHDRFSKSKYPDITLKSIKNSLLEINDKDISDFHLNHDNNSERNSIYMTKNDGKDIFRNVKTRQGQHKWRQLLINNYQSKCALCNINNKNILVASHIKTWAESSQTEKVDPCNGILLCVLHDALFEHGYISIDDNYDVITSLNFDFTEQGIDNNFSFSMPNANPPSLEYLYNHRIRHGFSKK